MNLADVQIGCFCFMIHVCLWAYTWFSPYIHRMLLGLKGKAFQIRDCSIFRLAEKCS